MRENTARQIITTVNFVDNASATHEWTPAEVEASFRSETWNVIDAYAAQHGWNAREADYVEEFGYPQVFEYELPGLRVVALMHDGRLSTVFSVEDADTARLHTAARTGRTMSIRYVKTDGSVSIRKIAVGSVRLTKAGHVAVRATDLKIGEDRTFRADRMTHTTMHRTVAPGAAAPSKTALAAEFVPARPAAEGHVRHTVREYTGQVIPGTRGLGASGWSVIVKLDAEFAHLTPGGTVRASETDLEPWIRIVTDVYDTEPGTAAALEAPEAVQDQLAERFALGHAYAFVTA